MESSRDPRTPGEGPAQGESDRPEEAARLALRAGKLEEAVALAELALEGARSGGGLPARRTATALAVLGEAALRRERPREALPHLEESHHLVPRAFTASLIVRSLYRAGEWEEGVARCRGFLGAHQGDLFLRQLLVRYHFHQEDHAAAEEVLREILADHPDCAQAQALLIDARTRAAPPAERVKELEGLFRVESRRRDPQLRYQQGRNRLQAGDAAGACREFAEAVALEPENRFYQSQLAFALKRAGRNAEAQRALRELFLEDPGDVYVRNALQSVCRTIGDAEGLRSAVREAIRLHPDKRFLYGLLKKAQSLPPPSRPRGRTGKTP